MLIKNKIIDGIVLFDLIMARIFLKIKPESPKLLILYFHKLFANKAPLTDLSIDPQQGTTVKELDLLILEFLNAGYLFPDPEDIPLKLNVEEKYLLLTFDDGYANNQLVLPLLEKYKIHSIFFISSSNVINNHIFWWDIIHTLKGKGASDTKVYKLKRRLKNLPVNEVIHFIMNEFGNNILQSGSDYNRPFTPDELKLFCTKKYVHIGNHTHNHAILTNIKASQARKEIELAQENLKAIIGFYPKYISYPNGNFSDEIITICKSLNFRLGFTCIRKSNRLPFNESNQSHLTLNRIIYHSSISRWNNLLYRSDFSLYNKLLNIYTKYVSDK